MGKRLLAIGLLCFFVLSCVFASVEVEYDFEINGMMSEVILRQKTGIPKTAEFENVEELENQAKQYKSTLVNLRCFGNVEYVIDYNKLQNSAVVLYKLDVSKSLLALPYPKYDSNNGLSLKLKVVDDNVLGTFGKIDFTALMLGVDKEKFDSTWQKFANYENTFKFSNIYIGSAIVSGELVSKLYFGYLKESFDEFKKNSYAKGSISISNIKIGDNLTLRTSGSLNTSDTKTFTNWKQMFYNFSVSASFNALDVNISPAFSATKFPFKGVKKGGTSYFTLSLGFSGIKFAGGKISITPSVRYYFDEDDDWSSKYVYYYLNSTSFSKGRFGLSNSTYWYYPKYKTKTNENIQTTTTLRYKFNDNITPSISGTFRYYPENSDNTYVEFIEMASTHFHLGELPVSLSAGIMERPYLFNRSKDKIFNMGFLGDFSTSIDKINYTEGEFRLGYKLNWVADAKYTPVSDRFNVDSGDGKLCPSYVRTRLQFTWFPVELWGWFNPSMRVTATYSNIPFYHYSKKSNYKNSPYAYYFNGDNLNEDPKGYGIDYTNRTQTILLGEYLRGIRNDNKDAISIEDDNIAVVVNLNATAKFIKLGNLADTYVNPFMDFAMIMRTKDKSQNKKFLTVGFEGIGVLKSHTSYPIRASLGFNAKDLIDFVKNPSKGNFPEYELYIGLYHFFEYKH